MLASDSRTPAWKGGPSLVLLPTLLMDSLFMKHGTQETLSRENTLQTSQLADGGFFYKLIMCPLTSSFSDKLVFSNFSIV